LSSPSSDTNWLNLLKAGEKNAAQILWERYFRLLMACAKRRLGTAAKRVADEEDMALSAFASFCRGVEAGRFPRLEDRSDLRNVLLLLVARKSSHYLRDELCGKRGGGKVRGEAELADHAEDNEMMAQLIDSKPTPELAVQISDECDRLLGRLKEDDLRSIALLLVEGYTVDEIAMNLDRSPRTIARKIAQIRDIWSEERGVDA